MTVSRFRISAVALVSTLSINSAFALPIDWSGTLGMDTTLISNMRRTKDDVTKDSNNKTGTEGIANGDNGASFQSYIFKLNPQIIVNDGVTLKGELSTGYIRGGFAGDNSANSADGAGTGTANGSSSGSYFFTTPAQRSALNVNQMYMELYADTALVKIGRMSKHYGMGIVWDNGNDPWDRFLTMYDGIEATMKIGNFSLTPYYAKISSYGNSPTSASQTNSGVKPNGIADVRELGLTAQYENKNRDIVVSVLYAKRSSEPQNSLYGSANSTTNTAITRGKTNVTVIEPYISKRWNKLFAQAEASLQSGEYGKVYDANTKSKLNAHAYIVKLKYDLNPKWDVGFDGGQVTGDKGSTNNFEAAYLHPNFQIAELMFRYNYVAFNEGGRSIYDSSITNTNFYKIAANYKTDKWTWKGAMIMAKAMQTAKGGSTRAYHHEENYAFTSNSKQNSSMGTEIDFGFDYRWNPNVTISGTYGYWMVGDYYAFANNSGSDLSLTNVHGGSLRATLEF